MDDGSQAAKMFVGGLPQTVTSDSMRAYFGRYGTVIEAFVLMDEMSGRSRGFGFVTFERPDTLQAVLRARPHTLDNKQVDCKHAVMKGMLPQGGNRSGGGPSNSGPSGDSGWSRMYENKPWDLNEADQNDSSFYVERNRQPGAQSTASDALSAGDGDIGGDEGDVFLTGGGKSYLALSGDKWLEDCAEADERKIFVGGLPDVTPAEFASYFEHFGPVSDAMVMFDRKRRRQRGFGFITFSTKEGVHQALQYHRHPVKGKLVEVKKAHPLVLQKARAPARRERDAALQREMQREENREKEPLVDPFGISDGNAPTRIPAVAQATANFPDAPWNQPTATTRVTPNVSYDPYGGRPTQRITTPQPDGYQPYNPHVQSMMQTY